MADDKDAACALLDGFKAQIPPLIELEIHAEGVVRDEHGRIKRDIAIPADTAPEEADSILNATSEVS